MKENIFKDFSFGAIVFSQKNDELKFLLVQMKDGHISFPKGHPQDNEKIPETVKREIFEETGLTKFKLFDDYSFISNYQFEKDGKMIDKTSTYYLAEYIDGEIDIQIPEEIIHCQWYSFDEALNAITYKNDKDNLILAKNKIKLLFNNLN